jgi:TIR domain
VKTADSDTTQVFLSYAREDRASAQALAAALDGDGHNVWWDRELEGGSDFANEIERRLAETRVAVVLWSAAAVQSGFVRDESARARDGGKLLPVRIEDVPLPLGFGTLHTLDLLDWDGSADDEACIALRDAVKRHLGGGAASLPQPLAALPIDARSKALARRRWHTPAAILVATAAVAAGAWWWVERDDAARAQALAREDALRQQQQRRDDEAQAEAFVDAGLRCNDELLRSASSTAVAASSQCALDLFTRALAKQPNLARAYYYLAQEYLRLYQQEQANGRDGEHLLVGARESLQAAGRQQPGLDEAKRATVKRQLAAMDALAQPEAAALSDSARAVPALSDHAQPSPPPPAVVAGVIPSRPTVGAGAATPSPAPAEAKLIRVAPSAAQQQLALAETEALLGPQREAQLVAASALTLDATLAADALPLLLQRTLASLAAQPDAPSTRDAVALALRQLRSASPALQRELSREAQRVVDAGKQYGGAVAVAAGDVQTRLARAQGHKPFVFVQIGDEAQRPLAERVVARLAALGYSAPGIENTGIARLPARTEVRLQGTSDPALARWMAQHLGKLTQAEVPLVTLRRARPLTDTYEIWFDKELCLTPARTVPACSGGG